MLRVFAAVVRRDLELALRRLGETLLVAAFFAIALVLFPLGLGPGPELLARIGPGLVWVLALLAVLLGLDRLWQAEFEDGSLEQFALAPVPLAWIVLARCIAHWLTTGVLLAVISPLLVLTLGMPGEALWLVPLSLILGTPALSFLGSIGAALLIGSRRGGTLTALLVLPLEVPVLIFGVGAIEQILSGPGGYAPLLLLAAISLFTMAFAPSATAAALRLALAA